METGSKPSRVTLASRDFKTPAQKAAAEAILEHWNDTHEFAEIGERSGWSQSHIRKVFYEYFEEADEDEASELDLKDPNSLPDRWQEVYRLGYSDGFDDGVEWAARHSQNSNEKDG